VIDSLLKGTANSIIHWIKIRAVWRPLVRLDEVDVLQIVDCIMGRVRCHTVLLKCPFVMMAFCSDVRQQALFQDDLWVTAY